MPKLKNTKWEAFAIACFKGLSETDAYIQAGYKNKATAQGNANRLFRRKVIQDRIKELQAKTESNAVLTVVERKKILSEIARAKLSDYLEAGQDTTHVNFGEDSPNPRAVREIAVNTTRDKEGNETFTKETLKLHNPVTAINELNKMEGQHAPEKRDITGDLNIIFQGRPPASKKRHGS